MLPCCCCEGGGPFAAAAEPGAPKGRLKWDGGGDADVEANGAKEGREGDCPNGAWAGGWDCGGPTGNAGASEDGNAKLAPPPLPDAAKVVSVGVCEPRREWVGGA